MKVSLIEREGRGSRVVKGGKGGDELISAEGGQPKSKQREGKEREEKQGGELVEVYSRRE